MLNLVLVTVFSCPVHDRAAISGPAEWIVQEFKDMARWAIMVLALASMLATAMPAEAGGGYRISRAPDPAPDDPLREEKLADRQRVIALNQAQARTTAARDRSRIRARDEANARAQAKYRAAMADWRRRVAACRGGDWSQCDR